MGGFNWDKNEVENLADDYFLELEDAGRPGSGPNSRGAIQLELPTGNRPLTEQERKGDYYHSERTKRSPAQIHPVSELLRQYPDAVALDSPTGPRVCIPGCSYRLSMHAGAAPFTG